MTTLHFEFYGLVCFYPKRMYWLGQKKLGTFYPRQDFLYPMFIFLYDITIKQMKQISLVLLCKKTKSFICWHFSCIVNVFDYYSSSQAITLFGIENRGSKTILGSPPLALVIDTCVSANLTIKHKKQKTNLFSIILFFNSMLLPHLCPSVWEPND